MYDEKSKLPLTMKEAILDAERDENSHAIEGVDGRAMTYGQLRSHIRRIVGTLNGAGYRRGDRFATVLNNGPEQFGLSIAIMSGFVIVPMNPNFREEELARFMKGAGIKAVVVESQSCLASEVAKGLGIEVYELVKGSSAGVLEFSLNGRGAEGGPQAEPEFSTEEDICAVFGTSGTTSRPKLVPLTQANILWAQHFYWRNHKDSQGDRCLAFLPIFYAHGLCASLRTIFNGGCVVYAPTFDPRQFYQWLDRSRPTWMTAGPTNYQAILEHAEENVEIIARSAIRYISTGNAMMPSAVMRRLESLFGAPVLEAYAMTEAGNITNTPAPPMKSKQGSAGISWGTEVAIMEEDGSLLPSGKIGEIVIRGKAVMGGYENDPEANALAFRNGWFRTGDMGYLDEDGYLFIKGRLKEIINRGGEKVAPREVEEVLLSHPSVKEAVVFSMRHPKLGEDIAAAVVLREGSKASEGELKVHVSERLAFFKVPTRVLIVGELPKGATGKVSRAGMAESLGLAKEAWGKTEYVPPTTETEGKLVRLLESIFPGVKIGVEDSFFDLGGYSLMAVRLFNEIEKEFGVRLPLSTLFQCPTVVEMAALLGDRSRAMPWTRLVPLQANGSMPPLFLIHGGDGDVINYKELVKALGDGRRIYGMQAKGLDGREEPDEDVVKMAGDYLKEISAVQAEGPYFLMGFSAGGVIAFEMARQLEAMGKKVSYVGIIDMDLPDMSPKMTRRNTRRSFFRQLYSLLRDLRPESPKRRAGMDLKLRRRMEVIAQSGLASLGIKAGDITTIIAADALVLPEVRKKVWLSQARAVFNYRPRTYGGRVTVFEGQGVPFVYPPVGESGWERFASGGTDVFVVPGRIHGSQLRHPNVGYLAELTKRVMSKAEGSAV